jgi:hypothetical protein
MARSLEPSPPSRRVQPNIEPHALAEIDCITSVGVRFRCVLADAGYRLSAPFRQGLTGRKLAWAVGIPRRLKVYPVGVQLIWPITKVRGRRGDARSGHFRALIVKSVLAPIQLGMTANPARGKCTTVSPTRSS